MIQNCMVNYLLYMFNTKSTQTFYFSDDNARESFSYLNLQTDLVFLSTYELKIRFINRVHI